MYTNVKQQQQQNRDMENKETVEKKTMKKKETIFYDNHKAKLKT